ncbi:MAG: arylsulfatase [Verrucomicrobiota bacterium]|nr:arylsulfatase [Verrucomicrobiota bacterium]
MNHIRTLSIAITLLTGTLWAKNKPNVIVILGDDMGIDSVSAFNSNMGLETPVIDRLASEGMSFSDAHSTSGVCSPTRYGLLTGRYNWRSRLKRGIVGRWERPLIADSRLTLPEMFRAHGYATCMIGKWHLGWYWPKKGGGLTEKLAEIDFTQPIKGGPTSHGFDYYYGDDVPNWPPYAWRENELLLGSLSSQMKQGAMVGVSAGPAVPEWDFAAVLLEYGRRCADYVRGRKDKEQPFFLYFPMPSPHTPIAPGGKFKGITGISDYADFLLETDWAVGEILKALDETEQTNNTVVIFTCDNGTSPKADFEQLDQAGVHLNVNWRGWKADAYEGGHRVPFIVRWPGKIRPNSRSDETIVLTDIMATCADILGIDLPPNSAEDSVSLLHELRGEKLEKPLHEIVIHHSGSGHFAIRKGRWKLLLCRGSGGWSPPREAEAVKKQLPILQLYNLANDPKESKNLYAEFPDRVEELVGELAKAFRNGRTTPGPRQKNEGWPNSIPKPVLQKFPQLADPKIKL